MKANDIYKFQYNAAERERLSFSADHCFEGTLRARPFEDGSYLLIDTYWGIEGNGRSFTPEEAELKGTLTFYCNLDDVEPIKDYEQAYYADDDLFTVSEQHACVPRCVHWFKRKGAVRNADKMLRVIAQREDDAHRQAESAADNLIRLDALRRQIQSGDLEVYL